MTPELLKALTEEARLHSKWPAIGTPGWDLRWARQDVAKAELRLRQPRVTADPGHPILSTYMGYLALKARKITYDVQLLNELQQASKSFPALPGPMPLLALDNGALAVGQASTIDAGLDAKVMWTEVSRRLARRDIAPLASVCQLTGEVCRKYSDQRPDIVREDDWRRLHDEKRQVLRMTDCVVDEAREASDDEDSKDSETAPRTVWAWGGSFAVHQSQRKWGNYDLLEILKREAEDLDFPTFLMKYLYAVHQVTPPASPQLEMNIKEIWGLHIGKPGVEALTAEEEDMVDQALGKPPVIRCRVCHKPSETGVHPTCP